MKVVIVIGEICSGKTTYANFIQQDSESVEVPVRTLDVGSIVREITATEERVFDETLDVAIINRLFREIQKADREDYNLTIVGVRQTTIYEAITTVCKDKHLDVVTVLLDVPTEIRKQRYIERNAFKDVYLDFAIADQKDKELGLKQLLELLEFQSQDTLTSVTKIKNY